VLTRLAMLAVISFATSGCVAAAALPIGLAALSGGASSAVKAGTDYTFGGTAYRTFAAPLEDVRGAVLGSFADLEIDVTEDEPIDDGDGVWIVGAAAHREIQVKLESITPMLTRLRMVVRQGLLGRDRATASELIEQTARALQAVRTAGAASGPAP
jgi:hypothetical protein